MFWRIIFAFHDKPATREDKLGSARCAHARYAGGKEGLTFAVLTSP